MNHNQSLNSDLLWFDLYKRGNRKAMERAFHEYYRPVFYYANLFLEDDDAAKDIVNESFHKAWNSRAKIESAKHFNNFLFNVTRDACISYVRKRQTELITEKGFAALFDQAESEAPIDLERIQTELIEKIYGVGSNG